MPSTVALITGEGRMSFSGPDVGNNVAVVEQPVTKRRAIAVEAKRNIFSFQNKINNRLAEVHSLEKSIPITQIDL
jgi:hypothetical protein